MKSLSILPRAYVPSPSRRWKHEDEESDRFYVYILKLAGGELYVGHSRELRDRMVEHKEVMTRATLGEKPKLRYFEILPTREDAIMREREIKIMVKTDRQEIFRMLTEFHDLISEVDKSI